MKRWVGLALLALLVWGVIFCLRVMYAEPVISVDYGVQIERLVRERQGMPDDAENGWEILEKLGRLQLDVHNQVRDLQPWAAEDKYIDVECIYRPESVPRYGLTSTQSREGAIAYLDELRKQGLFELQEELRNSPFVVKPRQEGLVFDWKLYEVGHARGIARINAARMHLSWVRGDMAEFDASMRNLFALSRVCATQYSLLSWRVGLAIQSLVLFELRQWLSEWLSSPEEIGRMEATLREWAVLPPIDLPIEGARLEMLDLLQSVCSDTGGGNGRLLLTQLAKLQQGENPMTSSIQVDGWLGSKVSNLAGIVLLDRRGHATLAEQFFDRSIAASQLRGMERERRSDRPERFVDSIDGWDALFIGIAHPPITQPLRSRDLLDLELAGTILMLRIEAHRARTGDYPDSLSQLDRAGDPPDQDVTLDPFTRLPFGYRRIDPAADPGKRPYLLYSLGRDLSDDLGEEARDRFDALWSDVDGAGYDFVINQPRKPPYVEDQLSPDTAPESPE